MEQLGHPAQVNMRGTRLYVLTDQDEQWSQRDGWETWKRNKDRVQHMSSSEIIQLSPKMKCDDIRLTREFYKCIERDCTAAGFPNLEGYCDECYVIAVRRGRITLSEERAGTPSPASMGRCFEGRRREPDNPPPSRHADYVDLDLRSPYDVAVLNGLSQRQPSDLNEWESYLCSAPNFTNQKAENADEMCLSCFRQEQRKPDMGTINPTAPIYDGNTRGKQKKRCSMSGCEDEVCPENEQLCQECYDVLSARMFKEASKRTLKAHEERTSYDEDIAAGPSERNVSTRSPYQQVGVNNSRTSHQNPPERPSAISSYQPGEKQRNQQDAAGENDVRWSNPWPFDALESQAEQPFPSGIRVANHIPREGSFTVIDQRRGFGRYEDASVGTSPKLNRIQNQAIHGIQPLRAGSASGPDVDETDTYAKLNVEMERSARGASGKCKAGHCSNFGNARCQGYCNSCYKNSLQ